ncbi:hypothetical protein ACWCQ0_38580 [Streptomyces massasporeus]|uniref:hypothetical protein n=1 Tax=Streptomyces massasporeus TaxID=67324 RepID=UPI0033F0E11B
MWVTFTLDRGSVTADLDPRLIGELHELMQGKSVQESEVASLLRQVSYFDNNKEGIISEYPGQVVVIGHEKVAFAGTQDEAFEWVSENPGVGPFYVVVTMTSESAGNFTLNTLGLREALR